MSKKITVGVVGSGGFVGHATAEVLRTVFTVETYDKYKNETNTCNSIEELAKKAAYIFVCVPTPMNDNGSCDTSIVEEVVSDINNCSNENIVIIRSTIEPGTTEKLNKKYKNITCVFNPEFLRESSASFDASHPTRVIIGGPRPASTYVKSLYNKVFPDVPKIKTSSTIAELVKYMTNCFLMTKVLFANEMYQICEALGEDYDKVLEYFLCDPRIGKTHLQVPSYEIDEDTGLPLFGAALSCFVKDLNALIYTAKQLGVDPKVMQAVWEKNLEVRPQRDWEKDKRVKK